MKLKKTHIGQKVECVVVLFMNVNIININDWHTLAICSKFKHLMTAKQKPIDHLCKH